MRAVSENLPVLLPDGGFKHSQHLHFDPQNPPPLCNLYVSMHQRLGIAGAAVVSYVNFSLRGNRCNSRGIAQCST
jgi:hypothetical protein